MPESISVTEFLKETWDDYNSPTTSTFTSKMPHCRNTAAILEELLDMDRSSFSKMKKSVKAMNNSGNVLVENEFLLAESLQKLGMNATKDQDLCETGEAFRKFSTITKDLSELMKNLTSSLNNMMLFPLDNFLKNDLKGVKGDLKKPFDKSWKDYESKYSKIVKQKKEQADKVNWKRDKISGAEIAEEIEKERKMFQLQMCEYLIKVNEIKTKKGVDLLQHLVEYYHAQTNFFQEGVKTILHYNSFIEKLLSQLQKLKKKQDEEKKKLTDLRDALKSTMTSYKEPPANSSTQGGYMLHQLQGNKIHGFEKKGYLLKKSEGKIKKVWQKRKCEIQEGTLIISHSDESKEPVKLNLLTCQVKLIQDDPGKKCFDLISSSKNRTYHFQGDDQKEMEEWISVLNNAKEEVLMKAFQDTNSNSYDLNQRVQELTGSIIEKIKRFPGNNVCCDCSSPDPQWLSTNLGILICLECCGIHRDLGVHISRTQSLVIDELGTSQLLLARVVGNKAFNEVMEAVPDLSLKATPNSKMEERKEFIKAKYEFQKYAIKTYSNKEDLLKDYVQAIVARDMPALLQVYAEGLDMMSVLPISLNLETALHLAIRQEDGTSLPIVDFIIQNSNISNLDRRTKDGNTVLHLCSELNQTECMKLLLRTKPDLANLENAAGQTPLDIAKEKNNHVCIELLKAAIAGKKDVFHNVNIDWDLIQEDHLYDFMDSDDDLDGTPDKKSRSRPPSLIAIPPAPDSPNNQHQKDAQHLRERLEAEILSKLPPAPPPASSTKPRIPGNTASLNTNNHSSASSSQNNDNGSSDSLPQDSSSNLPPLPPRARRAPAPLPPGHTRNLSEPEISYAIHRRTPSEPPPRPDPPDARNTYVGDVSSIAGGRILPPIDGPDSSHRTTVQNPVTRSHSQDGPGDRPGSQNRSKSSDRSSTPGFDLRDTGPPPVPVPRVKKRLKRRCKAIYDCDADNDDELTFREGEIIIILKEEEDEWWEGEVEGHPQRRGLFPVSFVTSLD